MDEMKFSLFTRFIIHMLRSMERVARKKMLTPAYVTMIFLHISYLQSFFHVRHSMVISFSIYKEDTWISTDPNNKKYILEKN